jgi:hypothetical protein
MRRLALVLALLFPAAARAEVRPLAPIAGSTSIALAGEQALFTQIKGRTIEVNAVPLTGGPVTRVFGNTVPKGWDPDVQLAASAQRAALVIVLTQGEETITTQAFSGPLGAPWSSLGPRTRLLEGTNIGRVQVDGDRLFTQELRGSLTNLGATVYDPQPHDIPFYSPLDASDVVFSGDLMAFSTGGDSEDLGGGPHVVVKNWRTGVEVRSTDLKQSAETAALRPDGAVLTRSGPITLWEPGAEPRELAQDAANVAFAGGRPAYTGDGGVRIGLRRVGPPTRGGSAIAGDDRHVLWEANDCLIVADVTDGSTGALGPGPCKRSEIASVGFNTQKLARTLRVPVACVVAPTSCTGTVQLPGLSGKHRFSIASGKAGKVRVPLTAAGYAALRRRHGIHDVGAVIRTDDGTVLDDVTLFVTRR